MKRLMAYVKPYFGYISLTVAIKFIATIFELFIPNLMQTIIDDKQLPVKKVLFSFWAD